MLKIKEVLRFYLEFNLSARQIALSLNMSHTVVNGYLKRFKASNLSLSDIDALTHKEIVDKLFESEKLAKVLKYAQPDFALVFKELKRKGVTLELLHEEYVSCNPTNHYGYTWFCNNYNKFIQKINTSMRQTHIAGEKAFIDYSGMRSPLTNEHTGEITFVEIFVAVLGASGYPFATATLTQRKEDFIESHNAMFTAFKGVPKLLVPDCLKSAVTRACKYEPDINADYALMAKHYGCAIFPARPHSPKDKSLVENGVKLVQRWILARLRNHTFFTLRELNSAISKLLDIYRDKVMKRVGKSRRELFVELEQPALLPLPIIPYEYMAFKLLSVSIDYHISLEYCMYSVPYQLVRKKVEVWYSKTKVTICFEGKEIATHPRLYKKGSYSTYSAHMSVAHQKHLQWSPTRIIKWGSTIGANTALLLQTIMETKPHPEMGYRACLGIMREFNKAKSEGYSEEDLDAIAKLAIKKMSIRVKQVKELIKFIGKNNKNVDAVIDTSTNATNSANTNDTNTNTNTTQPIRQTINNHANIRGASYYKQQVQEQNPQIIQEKEGNTVSIVTILVPISVTMPIFQPTALTATAVAVITPTAATSTSTPILAPILAPTTAQTLTQTLTLATTKVGNQ